MVDQIDRRTYVVFGGQSSGITCQMKQVGWQKVTEAVSDTWYANDLLTGHTRKCKLLYVSCIY